MAFIDSLPNEILKMIFSYLDPECFLDVCKRWDEIGKMFNLITLPELPYRCSCRKKVKKLFQELFPEREIGTVEYILAPDRLIRDRAAEVSIIQKGKEEIKQLFQEVLPKSIQMEEFFAFLEKNYVITYNRRKKYFVFLLGIIINNTGEKREDRCCKVGFEGQDFPDFKIGFSWDEIYTKPIRKRNYAVSF